MAMGIHNGNIIKTTRQLCPAKIEFSFDNILFIIDWVICYNFAQHVYRYNNSLKLLKWYGDFITLDIYALR